MNFQVVLLNMQGNHRMRTIPQQQPTRRLLN